jgi:hypothetical protein
MIALKAFAPPIPLIEEIFFGVLVGFCDIDLNREHLGFTFRMVQLENYSINGGIAEAEGT